MPWITEQQLKVAVSSVMGNRYGSPDNLPTHWNEPVRAAVAYAKNVIVRALAVRGFRPDQVERWDELFAYHRRVAICNVFREGGINRDNEPVSLSEYCKAVAELAAVPFTIDGVVIDPKGATGGCSSGDFAFTDEFRVPGGFASDRPRPGDWRDP